MDEYNIDTKRALHAVELHDVLRATRNESTYLGIRSIASILAEVYDEAECERLAELIVSSR